MDFGDLTLWETIVIDWMVPLLTAAIGALATAGGYSLMLVRKQGEHDQRIANLEDSRKELRAELERRFSGVAEMHKATMGLMREQIKQATLLIAELKARHDHS